MCSLFRPDGSNNHFTLFQMCYDSIDASYMRDHKQEIKSAGKHFMNNLTATTKCSVIYVNDEETAQQTFWKKKSCFGLWIVLEKKFVEYPHWIWLSPLIPYKERTTEIILFWIKKIIENWTSKHFNRRTELPFKFQISLEVISFLRNCVFTTFVSAGDDNDVFVRVMVFMHLFLLWFSSSSLLLTFTK